MQYSKINVQYFEPHPSIVLIGGRGLSDLELEHRPSSSLHGLVEDYIFYKMTPNFMGHSYVTETPNIMGLSYVLSFMGLSYVAVTHNVMGLSYVQ